MSHTGLTEAAGDSSAGRDRLQHSLPPIQAKSAGDNRCAANEGVLFLCVPDVRQRWGKFPESEAARPVIVSGERELKGKGLSGEGWGGKHSNCLSGSNDSFITTTRFMALCVCMGGRVVLCHQKNRRSHTAFYSTESVFVAEQSKQRAASCCQFCPGRITRCVNTQKPNGPNQKVSSVLGWA